MLLDHVQNQKNLLKCDSLEIVLCFLIKLASRYYGEIKKEGKKISGFKNDSDPLYLSYLVKRKIL